MPLIRSGKNLITSYGLFWDLDETEWLYRDRGKRRGRLLGRLRKKGAGLWLHSADFWSQSGIYVLYGNYGPYYVGVSKELGKRIHDHVRDQHTGKWDRFSWFGFREVLADRDADSFLRLGKAERYATVKLSKARADIEAILFRAFQGSGNSKNPSFGTELNEWKQIKREDTENIEAKIRAALTKSPRHVRASRAKR